MWNEADIGIASATGSCTTSAGAFNIYGGGADSGGTSDNCHLVYRPLAGDFSIQARITAPSYINSAAQFGLMARNDLTTGSQMISAYWSPLTNYFKSLARVTAGGITCEAAESSNNLLPMYARITRAGNVFTAYKSTDGISFTQVRQETIAMNNDIYVGMYVCSHDTALANVTYDNVAVVGEGPVPHHDTHSGACPGNSRGIYLVC